ALATKCVIRQACMNATPFSATKTISIAAVHRRQRLLTDLTIFRIIVEIFVFLLRIYHQTDEGDMMTCPRNDLGLVLTVLFMLGGCIDASTRGVQGSGVAKTETRGVEQFTSIKLDGAADVTVNFGAERSLTITA